jgi:hypothetical protein
VHNRGDDLVPLEALNPPAWLRSSIIGSFRVESSGDIAKDASNDMVQKGFMASRGHLRRSNKLSINVAG